MRHHAPCVWRRNINITYSSMRRRAPGGVAHRCKDYTHISCATMRQGDGAWISRLPVTTCAGARQLGWRMNFRVKYIFYFKFKTRKIKKKLLTLSMRRHAPGGWCTSFKLAYKAMRRRAPGGLAHRWVAHEFEYTLLFHAPASARGAGAWI